MSFTYIVHFQYMMLTCNELQPLCTETKQQNLSSQGKYPHHHFYLSNADHLQFIFFWTP